MYAVFNSECADAHFCFKIIEVVMQVFAGYSCPDIVNQFADRWVYQVVRVSKTVDRCAYKLSKLVTLNLKILQ